MTTNDKENKMYEHLYSLNYELVSWIKDFEKQKIQAHQKSTTVVISACKSSRKRTEQNRAIQLYFHHNLDHCPSFDFYCTAIAAAYAAAAAAEASLLLSHITFKI